MKISKKMLFGSQYIFIGLVKLIILQVSRVYAPQYIVYNNIFLNFINENTK